MKMKADLSLPTISALTWQVTNSYSRSSAQPLGRYNQKKEPLTGNGRFKPQHKYFGRKTSVPSFDFSILGIRGE
jgi:hypothetical protein